MSRPDHTSAAPAPSAPRFATGWAAVVFAIGTLLLGYPALAGKFLITPFSDQYIAGYAFREFAASTLKATGGFPHWNPYLFGGMPYAAAMHGDIFYPTFLLRMVLPTDVAMTWSFMIHVFLAGFFSYLFLRAWGFGFYGALIGGLAYMMGGNVAALVSPGHDGKLYVSALFPLTLFLLVRGVRDGKRWAWGALAITVGLAVLSPHPQLLQYLLLAGGCFALFLAFADLGEGAIPRNVALRRLGIALGSVVLGGLIGAIQYVPVRGYVPFSPRAGGKGWEHAISYSMPPEELINTYLPQFSGILTGYWGRNGIHFHSEYVGAAVLVLATLAFGGAAAVARRKWVLFWLGTLIVTVLWALGGYTPFYHIVYAIVPGTKYFRAPSTILYIVSFAVAMLAAVGAEKLVSGEVRTRRLLTWLGVGAFVGVLATLGAFTNLGAAIANPARIDAVYANAGAVTLGAWRSFLFVALVVALGFGVAMRRLPATVAGWALVAVVGLDLWSVVRQYWPFSPPASKIYAPDATVEYLQKLEQPGRVIAYPLSETYGYHDPFLLGDALMTYRIRNVLGYHGNEIGRYQQLYSAEGALANPNFWQLANVQYFLTNVPELPFPGATRVAGPATNAAGTISYLFRMPGENPFAWVAPVMVKAPDEQVLGTILDPRFDVRRAALFDTSAAVEGKQISVLPEPLALRPKTTHYEAGKIALELDQPAPAGSALIVSENYYPGWRVTVDGKPGTVQRADYTFMGIPLPEGARRVELVFDSENYDVGRLVTLLALAVSVLAWIGGGLVERRGRRG